MTEPSDITIRLGEDLSVRFDGAQPYTRQWISGRCGGGRIHEQPAVIGLLRACSTPGTRFCDVGAHIGYFSCFARAAGAEVLAVEMNRHLAPLIERNLARNPGPPARVLTCALADRAGVLYGDGATVSPCLFPTERPASDAAEAVPALRLDDMFADGAGPDVVKIDVEGYEAKVLAGAARTLAHVRELFVELHPANMAALGDDCAAMVEALAGAGFSVAVYGGHRAAEGGERPFAPGDCAAETGDVMVHCVRAG